MKKHSELIFKKLHKVIKTRKDAQIFVDLLLNRILQSEPITDKPLLDGFIIGAIYSNSGYVYGLITNIQLPPMSDNGIQQLEQIVIWMLNNEDTLVKLYKNYKKVNTIE